MSFKYFLLLLPVLVLSLCSCEKEPDKAGIKAVTGDVVNVGYGSAVLTGSAVVPNIPTSDIAVGMHYSLSEGMDPEYSTEVMADTFTEAYSFSVEINGLEPDTKYYYRAFVKKADVCFFGETESFTTAKAPVIKLSKEWDSFDYMGHAGSFDVTVDNPVSESPLIVSTNDSWITDIKRSGRTVTYKVSENTGVPRTGKIKLYYAGLTNEFFITQSIKPVSVPVDLGLSVKWATCNVGASKPEDYGSYYQWAGIRDVSDTSICLDLDNCPYHIGSERFAGWTKYIPSNKSSYWSGTGSPDNKTVLDPEDDIAHVEWGGSWRMPTEKEWIELRSSENCSCVWTSINGVHGYKVQSKKPGYTNNWIFFPAAGYRYNLYLTYVDSACQYWSSSIITTSPAASHVGDFVSVFFYTSSFVSEDGCSVRPVSD